MNAWFNECLNKRWKSVCFRGMDVCMNEGMEEIREQGTTIYSGTSTKGCVS